MTYNCIKTTTTAAAIGTGNATVVSVAAARARPLADIPVGKQVVLRIEDESGTDWELSRCTILSATTFSRDTVINGTNGPGAKTVFGAGAKTVQLVISADDFDALMGARDVAFSQTVPLVQVGIAYMPQMTMTGNLAFAPAAGAVRGAFATVNVIGDGASAATFPGFKQSGGSQDFDSRAGILNVLEFSYDGYNYWYAVMQQVNAQPVDNVAPTIAAASVASGTPTTLILAASEALDPNYTPAASAFAVTGHTVSGVAVSGASINLTVSPAFANGEAARAVSYTQQSGTGARDVAGNLLATFSGRAVTNNVQPADTTAPTVSSAQVANGSPSIIQITMSETLAASVPAASAFTASGRTVSSVAVSGAMVSVTVSAPYLAGDTITVSYAQPGASPRLQDAAGNVAASFGPVGVANNIAAVASNLRLATLDKLTESGAGPYTYTLANSSGSFGTQGGVSGQSRPASTDASALIVNTTGAELIFGVTQAVNAAFTAMDFGIWTGSGSTPMYTPITGGSIGSATTTAKQAGDVIRGSFIGTTYVVEVARSAAPASFATVFTFTGVSAAARKYAVNMAANGSFNTGASAGLA